MLSFASIIEKEAKLEGEKRLVSAVFHNRLRIGMSLDADPTVIYGRGDFNRGPYEGGSRDRNALQYLPPEGPAQGAHLQPFEKLDLGGALSRPERRALYFVSRNDGSHVFSKTMEEHKRFVAMYQRRKGKK